MGTRAPIEDGFDGAGVYAGRFRPTSSACSLQPPKVLGLKTVSERYIRQTLVEMLENDLCMGYDSCFFGDAKSKERTVFVVLCAEYYM
jgi:hypothetical protein